MTPDHYATLDVPPTANAATIRAAYVTLMREHHPDRNRDPAAAERARAVIAAFKVLGDFDRRNRYDWDRRRAREAAEAAAEAAKRPRWIRAGAIGAGTIGLAAVATWGLVLAPSPRPMITEPRIAETRERPASKAEPRSELKRMAAAAPVEVKAEKIRLAKVERRATPVAAEQVKRVPVMRMAVVEAPAPRAMPKPALASPRRQSQVPSEPAGPMAKPAPDLASLDEFVMNFYGQSWRYGDAPKRAALERSRARFVARRGGCSGDSCKREAYLKLMREVSTIVERGRPETP